MLPVDTMGEDESLALYPLGPSFMPVTAAADWNGTGHSGMVETTRGVAGGTQVFSDEEAEEAPTAYERRWFGSEWSEWEEVGGGGGDIPDHIEPLATDSRTFADEPDAYPLGYSHMRTLDYETEGTFAYEWNTGIVLTIRPAEVDDSDAPTIQLLIQATSLNQRNWDASNEVWNDGQRLATQAWVDSRLSADYYTKTEIDGMLP